MELVNEHNKEVNGKEPRPVFLTVLCILTLIYAGFSFIAVVLNLLAGQLSDKAMKQLIRQSNATSKEYQKLGSDSLVKLNDQLMDLEILLNNHHTGFTLFNLLAFGLGVTGAIMMLKRMKLGFHLYITYSFLTLIAFYLFVPVEAVPTAVTVMGLVLSLIFVLMYSRNLKWLK